METLSKHFKIPRYALEDVIMGKTNQLITTKNNTPTRHSEGGTTEETLSIHCKIPRYALDDVMMGKTNQLITTKNYTPRTSFRRRNDCGNFKHTLQDPTLRSG